MGANIALWGANIALRIYYISSRGVQNLSQEGCKICHILLNYSFTSAFTIIPPSVSIYLSFFNSAFAYCNVLFDIPSL